jgi:hypothetical protein
MASMLIGTRRRFIGLPADLRCAPAGAGALRRQAHGELTRGADDKPSAAGHHRRPPGAQIRRTPTAEVVSVGGLQYEAMIGRSIDIDAAIVRGTAAGVAASMR